MEPWAMKGADQCPKCGSRRWADVSQDVTKFYAAVLRVCGNCGCAWEPFDEADLLDEGQWFSSFKEPCNNCAFRPGSNEQADRERWTKMLADLERAGSQFFCHKGVPLDLNHATESDSGFAYPYRDGKAQVHKMRLCRGYLRMRRVQLDRAFDAYEAIGEALGCRADV
jgi:hypothetical protein